MHFSQTQAEGFTVYWYEQVGSTNEELRRLALAQQAALDSTVVITDQQTRGKGRQGRGWETPRGAALAVSALLRLPHGVPVSWVPLIVGSAVSSALAPLWQRPNAVGVKWPNDVHAITETGELGKKLCGILCELLPDGRVIIGVGTNLFLRAEQMPTERAGSLLTEGAALAGATDLTSDAGARLADAYVARMLDRVRGLFALAAEDLNNVMSRCAEDCHTLGSRVRLHLPDTTLVDGFATKLEGDGALRVRLDDGSERVVHAGDVEHLRPAPVSTHKDGQQ